MVGRVTLLDRMDPMWRSRTIRDVLDMADRHSVGKIVRRMQRSPEFRGEDPEAVRLMVESIVNARS